MPELNDEKQKKIPQKRAKRRRQPMTEKQLKYIANRAAGRSKVDSTINAGYKTSSTVVEKSNEIKRNIKMALEAVGVNEMYMAAHLKDGLKIRKESFTSNKTINDNDVQQRYAQLILRARGDIDGESAQTMNLGLIQIPAEKADVTEWSKEEN